MVRGVQVEQVDQVDRRVGARTLLGPPGGPRVWDTLYTRNQSENSVNLVQDVCVQFSQ